MLVLDATLLLLALVMILAGAGFFTNALEHVGQRHRLSEGLVGSVFAAVATALPETMVPVIAVFFGGGNPTVSQDVGIGAILGSPLMLITLAMALVALVTGMKRGWNVELRPELSGLLRDLGYFLVAYAIAFLGLFVPQQPAGIHAVAGFCLVFLYTFYVYNTMRASAALVKKGHGTAAEGALHLGRTGLSHTPALEFAQLFVGLVLIIAGSKLFVIGVEQAAAATGISPLVLSLIIVPVATEMPEKLNSILWVSRGKDTLAFGNLTGAMVFQGTLLPAFGLQLAGWKPGHDVIWTMAITTAMSLWVLLLAMRRQLTPLALLANGAAYAAFFVLIVGH